MNKRKLTSFGEEVKSKLIEHKMSQKQLSKIIGTSEVYLSMILYGERSGDKYIDSIKKVLDID